MESLVAVRHAESELNVVERLNGDPAVPCGLTEEGRAQSRRAATLLAHERFDVCVVSELERARSTAELILGASPVPVVPMPEFNETTFGQFEGQHWSDGYHEWALSAGPSDPCPGAGESRVAIVARVSRGLAALLARPGQTILLVTHGAVVRYALDAREGEAPQAHVRAVPPAEPFRFSRDEVAAVVRFLDGWLAEPAWSRRS
jgi:broad specificity phosphatase PhoE